MIPFGDMKRQYKYLKKEIDVAVAQVFSDGWFILGKQGEEFEKEFARHAGVKHAVGVGSGTEALHLALVALGVQEGDEVITVPNTAVFTVSAISFTGASPVLVDIDKDTYTLDPAKLEQAITKNTQAIIPVHLYGQCADMDRINEIAKKHNIPVIEDACQAHGAEYKGKRAGSLGDIGCFSFYPSKNLGACGDGGMAVTNDDKLAETLRLLRNGGQEQRYTHKIKGFNSRLDELQAAILRVKLEHLDKWTQSRREKAALYNKLITNKKIIKPAEASYGKHACHLYVIRSEKRDDLQKYLQAHKVQTLIHYPVPVHLQEAYRDLDLKEGSLPIAEQYAKTILSLPIFPELTNEEVQHIAAAINKF